MKKCRAPKFSCDWSKTAKPLFRRCVNPELAALLVTFMIMLCPSARAQQYNYVNYNIRDGLAGSVVYCMAQDHDGFIWFGTETGLSRFDGTRFKNFTTADGLPENEIVQIKVDSKNRIWILPFGNKICYFLNGQLHTEKNDSLLRRLDIRLNVSSFRQNKAGEIAIVERNRVSIIDTNENIKTYPPTSAYQAFSHAGVDFDDRLVIISNIGEKGPFVIKPEGDSITRTIDTLNFRNSPQNGHFYSSRLRFIYSPDSILIDMPGQRYFTPAPRAFINMAMLNDSLLAITSLSKTYTYNFRRGRVDHEFFTGKNITNVLEDREGNLWFSSGGDGVYRLPSTKFRTWSFAANGQKLAVYSLSKRKEIMWAGTEQYKLWQLNTNTNELDNQDIKTGSTSGRIISIIGYKGGTMMIGTDSGPFYLDKSNNWRVFHDVAVKSMVSFGDTILIGSNSAAFYTVGDTSQPRYIFQRRTTAVYQHKNIYYFGTLNGLFASLVLADSSASYLGGIHPALSGRIMTMSGHENSPLWVGTSGYGVAAYENGKVTAVLNTDSGLTSNIVRTLFTDRNILWVGTDKGLNKVENIQGRYKVTRYTTADGLASNMINALYVEDNGKTVYAGTPEGLTSFNEDSVFTNSSCILRITDIHSARRRTIDDTDNIRFEHFDNNIRFEFTGISFKSAGEINYRYRLQGLNNEWDTTRDNFLLYPTLPSGDYVLQLQAVNKFNVGSEVISIPFSIELLLWEKNWFRVLAIIFIAALVWIVVAWRIRRIRRQEQLKTETTRRIADLEQMALRAQMNPHFIFNSLNSIQHYVFGKDIQGANRFITEFSRLIRMTMEMSGKDRVSLEDEVRFLSTYLELEKKRFENKFVYEINVDPSLDPAFCFIPPMMLQPYVENGIRHGIRYLDGNDGLILLNFVIEGEYLVCSVEDNGIGREKSHQLKGETVIEYQSRGMTLTARRIEMINRNFNNPIMIGISDIYRDNKVAGTRVMIRIPLTEISKTLTKP